MIGSYHQTVKSFVEARMKVHKMTDKVNSKVVTQRSLWRFKRGGINNPVLTSGEIFRRTSETTVSRNT